MVILSFKIFFCQLITLQSLLTLDSRRCCERLKIKIQIMEVANTINLLSRRITKRWIMNLIGMQRVWFSLTYVATIISSKWVTLRLGSFQILLNSDIKTLSNFHIKWCNLLPEIVLHPKISSWDSRKNFNLIFLQLFLFLLL